MHCGNMKVGYLDMAIDMAYDMKRGESSCLDDNNSRIVCLEIGSYCGYSAVKIASRLRPARDVLYCVERDPNCVRWTNRLLEYAGVSDRVRVIEGVVNEDTLTVIRNSIQTDTQSSVQLHPLIDVLFIDHDKKLYLQDLKTMESSGLLHSGSVVVADNVLSFGVTMSDYLDHVNRPSGYQSSTLYKCFIEYSVAEEYEESVVAGSPPDTYENVLDGIVISVMK
jgi:catechol O-methyltransferase